MSRNREEPDEDKLSEDREEKGPPQDYELNSEDDEDLIIHEDDEDEQSANGAFFRRTSILQRNYHGLESNVFRLRLDLFIPDARVNDVQRFIRELNGDVQGRIMFSTLRFQRWLLYKLKASLVYAYSFNEQDVIAHAQQQLSNCIYVYFC